MDEDLNDDPEFNRFAAPYEVSFWEKVREAGIEQSSSLSKWLTASLLAINGAAAISAINIVDKLSSPLWPAFLFSGGIASALISGLLNQNANFRNIPAINNRIGYWLSVARDGERVKSYEGELDSQARQAAKGGRWGRWLGWVSGLLFLAGSVTLGIDAVGSRSEIERPCQQMRTAMLNPPLQARKDLPAVYTALGCSDRP